MNQYEFSDEINNDKKLAQNVIRDYARLRLQSMTPEEKDDWILDEISRKFGSNDGDEIVDILVNEYPEWLKSAHNVCII
jgi:flagellar motor switch protein FliG